MNNYSTISKGGLTKDIKPALLDDKRVATLPDGAWRTFVAALLLADGLGNLALYTGSLPRHAWGDCLHPIFEHVKELTARGLLKPYAKGGEAYAHIVELRKYVRPTPSDALVPGPDEDDGTLPTWFAEARGIQ